MKLPYTLNLNNSMEDFLQALTNAYIETGVSEPKEMFVRQCELLLNAGYDFYDLLTLYINMEPLEKEDFEAIFLWSPPPQRTFAPEQKNIRQAISRWTCSKYHTATIDEVVTDIQQKIRKKEKGLYKYNSNLNIRSRRSLNDLYILIIADNRTMWYDINRKITLEFLQNEGGK